MATARPRTAGLGAVRHQPIRVYNEPFNPIVEERDENQAYILLLQLPDFTKQNVKKVKVDKEAGTMVVTGDRKVGTNRLLILDKTFSIPQNSQIDELKDELKDGVLTITIPKQITESATAPPLQAAESTAASENAAPPETKAEIKEPDAAALPKDDSTPEKGREKISPENTALPETKAEIKEPEAAALPKDDSTQEKRREEISPENTALPERKAEIKKPDAVAIPKDDSESENVAPPETKAEIKEPEAAALPKDDSNSVKPTEEDEGKSADLQKQASTKAAKEDVPTPVGPLGEPEKDPVQEDSGKAKTTLDQKISSQDQKKENENQNPENGKEPKTEEVGKNEGTAEIGTGTPSPTATRVGKFTGGFTVGKLPLATVSLSATVVIAVAAYLAYAYYGFSFAM